MDHFDILEDLVTLIDESMADDPPLSARDGDVIKSGYHAEIDELRQISHGGKDFLLRLEAQERERTGIKSLKIGFNKVFGYYIEITNSNLANAPQNYIRKQTLVNGERYITEELKEWESKILTASEHMVNLEYTTFFVRSVANLRKKPRVFKGRRMSSPIWMRCNHWHPLPLKTAISSLLSMITPS